MRSSLLGSIIATAAVIASPAISARGAGQTLTADASPKTADYADDTDYRAVLTRYCLTCHNERLKTAGLMLDKMDLADIPAGAEVWEKVIRKVRAGMMPPPGLPRPEDPQPRRLRPGWSRRSTELRPRRPNPGRAPIHRLNRAEYANAIRDLLALERGRGASCLRTMRGTVSTILRMRWACHRSLLERYLSAAGRISALAVANRKIEPASETFRI